jgi:PAS domain S-box-containing protein
MRSSRTGGTNHIGEVADLCARVAKLERLNRKLAGRQYADEDLDKAWAEWERTFDAARDSIMVIDGDFKVIQANMETSRFLGKPLEQIIGNACWQVVRGSDGPCSECPLRVARSTGNREEAELYLPERDIWIEVSANPVLDDQGNVDRAIHIMRDITDRKKAEQTLREKEERYRSIFDNANDVIAFVSTTGKILDVNAKVKDVLGYDPAELIGKNFITSGILAVRNAALIAKLFKESVTRGGFPDKLDGRSITEVWLNHKNGHAVLVEASTTATRKDGKLAGFLSILRDVTDIRKSDEAYRSLVDHSLQGLAIFQDERIVFANRAMAQITGYTVEEMLALSSEQVQAFVHPDDRQMVWDRHRQRLQGKRPPERYELRGVRKDGSIRWLEIDASPVEYQGRPAVQAAYVDVTERRKAQEALRESEEKYRDLFENAREAIMTFDPDGTITGANRLVEEYGFRREELIGKPFLDFVIQDHRGKAIKDFEKLLAGHSASGEMDVVTPKGKMTVEYRDNPIVRGGRIVGVQAILTDVTEHKRVEQALRKERDKAQKYLDVAAVMMVAIDSERRVGLINKKGCEILGYPEEEILGKNWFDNFLPQRISGESRAVFERFVTGQADAPEYVESPVLTKDGRERLIAWHNTTLKDNEGRFVATLSSGEDITERRRAEEAMRQSEERYRDLFENAREVIVTFDLKANITSANKLVEEYGLRREDLIGKSLFDFVPADSRAKAIEDYETLISGHPLRGEMDLIIPRGTVTVEYSDNPIIRAGKVIGVHAILTDITDRKKAEERLLEYQAKLKAMASQILMAEDRQRKRLAVGLHDDICQKLAVAKLSLESSLSLISDAKLSASLRIAAEAIGQAIEEADSLTFELSNPILREFGFLAALEKYLTEDIQQKHGIPCELESDERIDVGALSKEVEICLFRATRELLTNVVRHAHANKIKVSVRSRQGQIHVCVQDDGLGFKYEQVGSEVSKTTRFGLFSIREQLEYVGGHLDVKSKLGRGARITIVVPLAGERRISDCKGDTNEDTDCR